MSKFFEASVFFGVFLSLISYGIGTALKRKFKLAMFNPLLIAVIIIMLFLTVMHIDNNVYQ